MNIQDARVQLEQVFDLLRDPDFDLFKHGRLNEALEQLQRLTRDPDSIQEFRHLTYAEMKGHRAELLARLEPVPELLDQNRLRDAVGVIRSGLRVLEIP